MKNSSLVWTQSNTADLVTIQATKGPIAGSVSIPGSKSYTNRALIISGISNGLSHVKGILRSDDSYWCMNSLRQLGVKIEEKATELAVHGSEQWAYPTEPIYIGSAGTTGRFLTSVLALTTQQQVVVTASDQLSRRPMKELFDALITLGANISYGSNDGCFPVLLSPPSEGARIVEISGSTSSQFTSGLLIAAPLIGQEVRIVVTDGIVQPNYIHVTLDIMSSFGINVEAADDLSSFVVKSGHYIPRNYQVEADASTASYFMALAAVTSGEITITNLNLGTLQPDIKFLATLEKMGCRIKSSPRGVTVIGPPRLLGGFSIDMKDFSDTALTLAAMAPYASGPIEITGVSHIRTHESDRLKVMADSLNALGVPTEERPDGLLITPAMPRYGRLDTADDHRVAMSLAVLGVAGQGIELINPGCVSKTCPQFFDYLSDLKISVSHQ